MNAYLISLDGSPRTKPATKRLAPHFPGLQVFPAIRPSPSEIRWLDMANMEVLGSLASIRSNVCYIPGAVGCQMSHAAAMRLGEVHAYAEGKKGFIILEDDAQVVRPDILKWFLENIDDCPLPMSVCLLDVSGVPHVSTGYSPDPRPDAVGWGSIQPIGHHRRTTAYWVSSDVAGRLAHAMRNSGMEADLFFGRMAERGGFYGCHCIENDLSPSQITQNPIIQPA